VAKMMPRCRSVLRDDGVNNYLMLRWNDFELVDSVDEVGGKAIDAWHCPACGRRWVFWDGEHAFESLPPHESSD
jgi:hypothetical protein